MQLFISYRREDTAGRAGRLFDALAGRFGARNVFQDVAAIAPGTDFDREITAAINRCDAVLVIIGVDWVTLTGPAGRRLDAPDDYVRREVSAALESGVPVVPVLVGGASLPPADELPESLKPLALRQAISIRDDAWHNDVEVLARRLRHEDVVGPHPRSRRLVIAGAAIAVLAAASALVLLNDQGDGTVDEDDGQITGCPEPSESWSTLDVADAATVPVEDGEVRLVFTVQDAALDAAEGRAYLEVEVRNESDQGSTEVPYFDQEFLNALLVDGLNQGAPQCLTVEGDPNLHPGQRAIGLVGFDLTEDPTGRPLVLELFSGDPDITITP